MQIQVFDPLQTGVDWLDKTGLLVGDVIGDTDCALLGDPIHDADVFGKSSAGGLETGGASDFFIGFALGKSFIATVIAFAARDVMEDHDAVSGLPIVDAFAYGCDLA